MGSRDIRGMATVRAGRQRRVRPRQLATRRLTSSGLENRRCNGCRGLVLRPLDGQFVKLLGQVVPVPAPARDAAHHPTSLKPGQQPDLAEATR